MRLHRRWQLLSALAVLVLALFLGACAARPMSMTVAAPAPGAPAPAMPAPAPPVVAAPSPPPPEAAPPVVAAPSPPPPPATPPPPKEFTAVEALREIHFDFDKYDIRPGDAAILDGNADWMKAHPDSLILIAGNCDERGTEQYNLALGERRAKATMHYLVARGVQADRITLVSYGKERPLCGEKTKECWARNRRTEFLAKER